MCCISSCHATVCPRNLAQFSECINYIEMDKISWKYINLSFDEVRRGGEGLDSINLFKEIFHSQNYTF